MNLLKIKNTIILTIAASAMSLMIFTMLQVFNKPDIKQINIPNIKDIELNSSIDTSAQSVLNSNNSNFDYQLIG